MGRLLFRFVVVGAIALGLGCGAGSSNQTTSPQETTCASYGEREYARFSDIPKLANGEISIGGKRYVLPMTIELWRDKIGLWCSGPVDWCFKMSDQDGQISDDTQGTSVPLHFSDLIAYYRSVR